jgi:ribose transport system substrate-binding protein
MAQQRVFSFLLLFLALVGCDSKAGTADAGSTATKKALRIAVIPKGTTHEFWKSIHAGAIKAARELQVEVVWKGPLKEDDLKQQIDLVQSFVAQRISGIVLAPLNDKALRKPVEVAKRRNIPVVVIDSGLKGKAQRSFVATDNLAAGKLAGKRMVEKLQSKGHVVMLRYQEGSASTGKREQGFVDAIASHKDMKLVSSNQFGGATTESAFKAAEAVLLAAGAKDGKVQGVFCPNESTTFGMLLALKKMKLSGQVTLIGFDASEKLVKALEQGSVDALVVQDPFRMGYLGVKTMVAVLKKQTFEAVVDTGSVLVTRKNMKQKRVQALLKPDLSKWLGE